jgi:hypothetical protein
VTTFTAYNGNSRNFYVVATDYPNVASGTFWLSTINDATNASLPVYTAVTIAYPNSQSPFPLDVAHLSLSRIIEKDDKLFAVFSNGDVYAVDLDSKKFQFLYSIVAAAEQLDPSFMSFTGFGHVYDSDNDCLWSIAMAGINGFLYKSSLTEGKVLQGPTPMTLPSWDKPDVQGGFSTETVVNMHFAQVLFFPLSSFHTFN